MGSALEVYLDPAKLAEMRACRFERHAATLDVTKFLDPATPFLGKSDGVPVVVFSDPNCEICRDYHAKFLRAASQFGDRARFTVVPRVIWEESVVEAAALRLAEQSGKYFELWQALFDRPPEQNKGMTVAQLADVFRRLGIDASNLEARIAMVSKTVQAARAEAHASGIDRVPAVYIAGRKVWQVNREVECIGKLIDEVTTEPERAPDRRRAR